jgi:hypothetical protein
MERGKEEAMNAAEGWHRKKMAPLPGKVFMS